MWPQDRSVTVLVSKLLGLIRAKGIGFRLRSRRAGPESGEEGAGGNGTCPPAVFGGKQMRGGRAAPLSAGVGLGCFLGGLVGGLRCLLGLLAGSELVLDLRGDGIGVDLVERGCFAKDAVAVRTRCNYEDDGLDDGL